MPYSFEEHRKAHFKLKVHSCDKLESMEEYVPPTLTVDAVIFQFIDGNLHVLLMKRGNEPFKGKLALPGGYNAQGETTFDATKRVLLKKTGVDMDTMNYVEQLYTFDTVARDPRGHAVSVVYMGLGRNIDTPGGKTDDDAQFYPVNALGELAYDHKQIIDLAIERLGSKLTYTNAVFALLPKMFTLTSLQKAYENILGREIDKRNFRKKYLALGLIKETDKMSEGKAHRPARLYTFNKQSLEILTRSFE